MWYNQPFSQRNKATKRAVGVKFGDKTEGRGIGQKKGDRQYREVFIKQEG